MVGSWLGYDLKVCEEKNGVDEGLVSKEARRRLEEA